MSGLRGYAESRNGDANLRRQTPDVQPYAFEDALDDDLNISAALGFLFESIRETNRAMDQNEMDAVSASDLARLVETD